MTKRSKEYVFLSLGSNKHNPYKQIKKAKINISSKIGKIIKESSLYITSAWGNTEQNDFLNQILKIETSLNPLYLMKYILLIEENMGRERKNEIKWGPRIIDIDIIFYGKKVLNYDNLIIPHPYLQYRLFVLEPLNEIEPDFIHPVLNKNVNQLLKECNDNIYIRKLNLCL